MKKSSNAILVVTTIVVIGVLGYLLLRKPKVSTLPMGNDNIPPSKEPSMAMDVTNKIVSAGKSVGDIISGTVSNVLSVADLKKGSNEYQLYAIKTSGGNVNVRSKPSSKATVVTQLESIVSIFARPSGIKGWSEVSNDKNSVLGYVSSQYLRKL